MQLAVVLSRLVSDARRLLPALLTLFALVLAVMGQRRLDLERLETLREGTLFFIAAALCMVIARLALRYSIPHDTPPVASRQTTPLHAHRRLLSLRRWGMMLAGLLVAVPVLVWMIRPAAQPAFSIYLWLLASALVTGAWLPVPSPAWRAGIVDRVRAHPLELLALSLITLLALLLRTVNLAGAPLAISGDEANLALEVRRVIAGDLQEPFRMIRGGHTALVAYLLAVPVQLFGRSIVALRMVSALWGTLAVPLLFLLARPIAGRRLALVAALFLATFPMHIHYSRIAPHAIWEATFFTGALAAFWWGVRRETTSFWPFAITGLLTGLSQYASSGSRLLPLLLLLLFAALALFDPDRLRLKLQPLFITLLVSGVVAGPIYLFAVQSPSLFSAHAAGENILQNGWLVAEMEIRGEGAMPILWDQFRRTLFGFTFFEDRVASWNPGTPLAPTLFSLGLFLGLAASMRSTGKWDTFLLHGWFWLVIVLAGALTLNPPSSHRLVVLAPVICLFAALGWDAIARLLAQAWSGAEQRMAAHALLVMLLLLTVAGGLRAHRQYLASHRFGGMEALIATQVGRDLATYPSDTTLVLLGAPRLYSDISPLAWLVPAYERLDIVDPLAAPPSELPEERPLLFVLLPHRMGEIDQISERFPAARREDVFLPGTNELLYIKLHVDR